MTGPKTKAMKAGRAAAADRAGAALALLLAAAGAASCSSGGGSDPAPSSPGSLELGAAAYSVPETGGAADVTVTRGGGSAGAVSVTVTTSDGGAVAPLDYGALSTTVTFADGDAAPKTVQVPVVDDAVVEGDETVTLTLSAATGGAVLGTQASASLTILDDDVTQHGTLELESADVLALEASGTATLVVVRTGGVAGEVSVTVSTADGTAVAPDDYGALAEVVTFADGDDVPKIVHLSIVDDTLAEGDESLDATLIAPTGGASLGAVASAVVGIRDDDARVVALSAPSFEVGEADGSALVTVTRTGDPSGVVSVTLSTSDGSAAAPGDYTALSTTVSFGDGDTSPRSVFVTVLDDALDEPDETVSVTLSAPLGGDLGRGTATLLVRDDDGIPSPPEPSVGARLKSLSFSWQHVAGATLYRLLQDPDGATGFSQVGPDIVASGTVVTANVPVSLHRIDWPNVRFRVRACNTIGCADSADLADAPLQAALLAAIGYLKASNTDQLDTFGGAVALSGDGLTLVVGATGEDSATAGVGGNQSDDSAGGSGAAYVFRRSAGPAGTWSQEAYLKASNSDADDYFGMAVAVSDDGNTVAVGARHESSAGTGVNGPDQADDSAQSAGAAYVFSRSGATWSQQAYVKASDTAAYGWFGSALALSGDGNTLAVGASHHDSNRGAVYVFTRSGDLWTQETQLTAPVADGGDAFGGAVALGRTGDRLVVGASSESSAATGVGGDQADDSALHSGAAYVFDRTTGVWSLGAYLKASNTDADDGFGYSVALGSDGTVLAVGAPGEDCSVGGVNGNQDDDTALDAGAAYVFSESGGVWSQQAYLKASNPEAGDGFGASVALNGPGRLLAVSAPLESGASTGVGGDEASNAAAGAGAVYVFRSPAGTWSQIAYVKAPSADAGDQLGGNPFSGAGVGVSLDGTGNTLAVGSSHEDGSATGIGGDVDDDRLGESGAVYLY